ncbi:MAG TPA: hypothetical protein ENK18_06950 [Deltaproteobacteria bacterium]|nr:hypothetical protein [Deltaproteobacteria bacterium]
MIWIWLAVASTHASDQEAYLTCLAYQQPAYDPDDPLAEDCTWTIGNHEAVRRLRLALSGKLALWIEDLEGDQALAELLHPELSSGWPEFDAHRPGPDLAYVSEWMEARIAPLRVRQARQMLAQVIYEEARDGIVPSYGEPIRWSRDFRRRHPLPKATRLLLTLSWGRSSYTLRTDREEILIDWLLARSDHSVTLEALFRQAYRACDGDVYLALLTAENVLSRYLFDPDRERIELILRLHPLIHTWEDRGDQFGAWYHLFGMMLYTYAEGGLAGRVAASAESFGSHVSNPPGMIEHQEDHINRIGAALGGFLRRFVRQQRWLEHTDDPGALWLYSYATPNPFEPGQPTPILRLP